MRSKRKNNMLLNLKSKRLQLSSIFSKSRASLQVTRCHTRQCHVVLNAPSVQSNLTEFELGILTFYSKLKPNCEEVSTDILI